jgi:ABC-type uncharacterized transport system involved in gliding motility auxiliary subunit
MNKQSLRRYAPIGLYLALLAAVVSAGLYIVQREWNLALQISLGLIVVGLAVFTILDPDQVRMALTGRQARYGSNALVLTIAFIGILVVVNVLVVQNGKRWDLTEDQQFTLASETLDTLKSLPEKVTATAFFTQRIPSETASNLLEQYEFNSNGNFEYTFIDPEMDPLAAQNANITRDGTVVVRMGDQQEPVTLITEQELTGAIVRLMNPTSQSIYFLTGHGEYSPDDTGDQGLSQVKRTLEGKNYTVAALNLLATNQIPDDAGVIVIAGPKKPVSQAEVVLLDSFLSNGGSLIVMEEPLPTTEFGDEFDPLAEYLAQKWGVILGEDIIVDLTSTQPLAPYAASYANHAITENMPNLTSQFPTARSVQAGSAPEGVSSENLVLTAQQSWAEADLAGLDNPESQIAFEEGVDTPGPVSLAAVAENASTASRLVVFGDSDFPIDANYAAYGNGDLITNAVDWAANQENLISLTPKQSTDRLLLPPQRITMNLILLGSVFILPGLPVLAGIIVWIQRRRRG